MTDDPALDNRIYQRRTYPDGRVSVWRPGVKGQGVEDVPLDVFKTLEDNGWVEIQYTDDRIILSDAGLRALRLQLLKDEIAAMRTQLAAAEATYKALKLDEPTPD